MGYITEYAVYMKFERFRRGPKTPLAWLFITLTVAALLLANCNGVLAKIFENESLRLFLKILLYIVAAVFFAATVASELKAD